MIILSVLLVNRWNFIDGKFPLLFAGRGRNDLDHTFSVNALVPIVRFKFHKRKKKQKNYTIASKGLLNRFHDPPTESKLPLFHSHCSFELHLHSVSVAWKDSFVIVRPRMKPRK